MGGAERGGAERIVYMGDPRLVPQAPSPASAPLA